MHEHGHRLLAMAVGLLQVVLSVMLVRRGRLRGLAVATLAAVVAQGTLGALTVYHKLPWWLSTCHLLLGFFYFAGVLAVVWRTRSEAQESATRGSASTSASGMRRWVGGAGLAVMFQVAVGGAVRHFEAYLACTDLPLCYGKLFPSDGDFAVHLHMFHRLLGMIVGWVCVMAAIVVVRRAFSGPMRKLALAVPVVVVGQIALGVLVVWTYRTPMIAVAHVGGAALLWGLFVGLWLMSADGGGSAMRGGGRVS